MRNKLKSLYERIFKRNQEIYQTQEDIYNDLSLKLQTLRGKVEEHWKDHRQTFGGVKYSAAKYPEIFHFLNPSDFLQRKRRAESRSCSPGLGI